jgi:glycosyltransferase involved in cell wall biosynthesis
MCRGSAGLFQPTSQNPMKTRPLSILQTCFSRSWGGLEMQALELSAGLRERGHRVTLAAPDGSRLALEAVRLNVRLLPLNVSGYFHPLLLARLRKTLRADAVDIIHCQHSRDLATVVPAMQTCGRTIPIVLSKRVGSYIAKKDLFHRYTHRALSRVLAISTVIHQNVLDTTPVPPERVLTLHDAVDTSLFSAEAVDPFTVRREAGIPDDALVVGFVGRFSPGKGLEELLQAAHLLLRNYPAVRYLIVGEASHGEKGYADTIHELSRRLGLQDVAVFAGYRSDIPSVMASFDILAFPSHAESFGVVLIEAMAMGKPVVSTNCDGVLDIVLDNLTGITVPPKDPPALAHGLERLITHPDLCRSMGAAGRARVLEHFDRNVQLRKLEEIYYSLV